MALLLPNDVLSRSRAQIVALPDRRLLVRHGAGLSVLAGLSIADLRRIVNLAGDGRRAEDIVRALARDGALPPAGPGGGDRATIRRQVAMLAGDVLKLRRPAVEPRGSAAPAALTVIGNGAAADRLIEALGSGPRRISIASFAVCGSPEFLAGEERSAVPREEPPPAPAGGLRDAGADQLAARLEGTELVICILEAVPWRALWEVQRACWSSATPALFLTLDPDGARVGPAVVPGATPCLACAQAASFGALERPGDLFAAIAHFRSERLRPENAPAFEAALAVLTGEARVILAGEGLPGLAAEVVLLSHGGARRSYAVSAHETCPVCAAGRPAATPAGARTGLAARVERALIERFERAPRRHAGMEASAPDPGLVRRVGIVGGGTAGYLAALALRAKRPELDVTLIESSALPVIGVGEATTPLMPQFLHADLGFDVHELFREVRPTFKLGIRFAWDARGPSFHYPFGPVHVLEPSVYDGDLRRCSLRSMMMSAGVLPAVLDTATAYHLDNRRFVRYLRGKARELGVETLDARIVEVELAEDGGEIRGLLADDGRRFAFDLYVDCSGFRSLLLEKGLGSRFVSYRPSLATDRAIVATVPHDGSIAPYTLAEAMDGGWCWSTPQRDADHRGYVFCSEFLSPEAAEAEMRRKNPGMGEARRIEFRAGRHEHFWRGNVVALGNAYGFVEPLESTALHMLIRQIGLLCRAFPLRLGPAGAAALLNRRVNDFWDYLRFFLALHYRFNRGYDSPFWRHCRAETDVSSHQELLSAFAACGPLSYDSRLAFDAPDPLWGAEGIDVVLLGQKVPARMPEPARSRSEWREQVRRCERAVASMAAQERALEDLDRRPEVLERFAAAFRAVGPAFPAATR